MFNDSNHTHLDVRNSKQFISKGIPGIGYCLSPDSDTAVVSFSGLTNLNTRKTAPFNFVRSVHRYPVNKIYLRDVHSCWYQLGTYGYGSVQALSYELKRMLKKLGTQHSIFVGNSAGGFAALLFGFLCEADHIVAISPQTDLSLALRQHADKKMVYTYNPNTMSRANNSQYFKASNFSKKYRGRLDIHYAGQSLPDVQHAGELVNIANYYRYNYNKHDLVKHLKNTKLLNRILRNAVTKNYTCNYPQIYDMLGS